MRDINALDQHQRLFPSKLWAVASESHAKSDAFNLSSAPHPE